MDTFPLAFQLAEIFRLLPQPWTLQLFGERTKGWKILSISFSLFCLSSSLWLCLSNDNCKQDWFCLLCINIISTRKWGYHLYHPFVVSLNIQYSKFLQIYHCFKGYVNSLHIFIYFICTAVSRLLFEHKGG